MIIQWGNAFKRYLCQRRQSSSQPPTPLQALALTWSRLSFRTINKLNFRWLHIWVVGLQVFDNMEISLSLSHTHTQHARTFLHINRDAYKHVVWLMLAWEDNVKVGLVLFSSLFLYTFRTSQVLVCLFVYWSIYFSAQPFGACFLTIWVQLT